MSEVFVNIDYPIGCLLLMASVCFLKDIFLGNIRHADVVVPSPLVVEVVLYEGIVVPAVCVSVMDTNCMQVIRVLFDFLVGLVDLLIQCLKLNLHVTNLV